MDNEYQGKSKSEIQKMYTCEDCAFFTKWPTSLRRHEKLKHNPCENNEMSEYLSCTYRVKRHKKFMHKLRDFKEMYECQDCNYSNSRRHENFKLNPNDLRKHKTTVHNPSLTDYHTTIDALNRQFAS